MSATGLENNIGTAHQTEVEGGRDKPALAKLKIDIS